MGGSTVMLIIIWYVHFRFDDTCICVLCTFPSSILAIFNYDHFQLGFCCVLTGHELHCTMLCIHVHCIDITTNFTFHPDCWAIYL